MIQYKDYAPTGFDIRGLNCEDQQNWWVSPCSISRDSGITAESNWVAMQKRFDDQGVEYEVHRFGHWACGWFEICLVRPEHESVVEELEASLMDYPVLDEDDLGIREWEAVQDYWGRMRLTDRIDLCVREGASIFAARRDSVPEQCYERIQYWVNE